MDGLRLSRPGRPLLAPPCLSATERGEGSFLAAAWPLRLPKRCSLQIPRRPVLLNMNFFTSKDALCTHGTHPGKVCLRTFTLFYCSELLCKYKHELFLKNFYCKKLESQVSNRMRETMLRTSP